MMRKVVVFDIPVAMLDEKGCNVWDIAIVVLDEESLCCLSCHICGT